MDPRAKNGHLTLDYTRIGITYTPIYLLITPFFPSSAFYDRVSSRSNFRKQDFNDGRDT